jgi:hypothetical protein
MSTSVTQKPSHWWRTGKSTPRRRHPLRWRPGATPPLVAWAEIRDWGLITIKRAPDGLLECRVVDKTRTVAAVQFSGVVTYDAAKKRCAEVATDVIAAREKIVGATAAPSAEVAR